MVSMAQIGKRKLEVKEKAIEQKENTDERKELQVQLDKYMGYLMNPQLNQTIKTNCEIMVLNIQSQLQVLTQQALPAFTSLLRPLLSQRQVLTLGRTAPVPCDLAPQCLK
jgi:hypothetical protein